MQKLYNDKKFDAAKLKDVSREADRQHLMKNMGGSNLFKLNQNVSFHSDNYFNSQLAALKEKVAQGKIKQAIEKLKELKDENFEHSDVYYLLGECYRRSNKMPEAIENLSWALRFEEYTEYVWKSLGLAFMKHTTEGSQLKGMKCLSKFLKLTVLSSDETNKQELELIGDFYMEAGFPTQAEQCFTQLLAKQEERTELRLKRGIACLLQVDKPDAQGLEDLKR